MSFVGWATLCPPREAHHRRRWARVPTLPGYVVRAFVQLRSLLAANEQLAAQLKALEKRIAQRLSTHDQAITGIIDTLRKLMQSNESRESSAPTKRPIGFVHPQEKSAKPKSKLR
jgi:hypothetical protein